MPAKEASAPHKATVENGSKATAAISQSWSYTGQGLLGRGNQQPRGSTQPWLEPVGGQTDREKQPEQGNRNSRSEGYVSEPERNMVR